MKDTTNKNKDRIVPMRIPIDLCEEVDKASEEIGLSKADTMRKSMEFGLPVLVDLLKRKPIKKAA